MVRLDDIRREHKESTLEIEADELKFLYDHDIDANQGSGSPAASPDFAEYIPFFLSISHRGY